MTREKLDEYYTPSKIKALRKPAGDHRLTISQFAVYSPAYEGMARFDPREEEGLRVFARGIQVCRELGCDIVNLVAHWPVSKTTCGSRASPRRISSV